MLLKKADERGFLFLISRIWFLYRVFSSRLVFNIHASFAKIAMLLKIELNLNLKHMFEEELHRTTYQLLLGSHKTLIR